VMTKTELHKLTTPYLRRDQDPVAAKLEAALYEREERTEKDLRAVREAQSEPGITWSGPRRSRTLADPGEWRFSTPRRSSLSVRRQERCAAIQFVQVAEASHTAAGRSL